MSLEDDIYDVERVVAGTKRAEEAFGRLKERMCGSYLMERLTRHIKDQAEGHKKSCASDDGTFPNKKEGEVYRELIGMLEELEAL